MRTTMVIVVICFSLILLPVGCIGCVGCHYVRDANQVVQEQFSPSVLLKKYEKFKDLAATIDAKRATIKATEVKVKSLEDQYKGVPRSQWARTDAEQHGVWQQELLGMKASHNQLAADFNSSMAKENYRFCNTGDLPRSNLEPLPREFKPYLSE